MTTENIVILKVSDLQATKTVGEDGKTDKEKLSMYTLGNSIYKLFTNKPPLLSQTDKLINPLNFLLASKKKMLEDKTGDVIHFEVLVGSAYGGKAGSKIVVSYSKVIELAEKCYQVQEYFKEMSEVVNPSEVEKVDETVIPSLSSFLPPTK